MQDLVDRLKRSHGNNPPLTGASLTWRKKKLNYTNYNKNLKTPTSGMTLMQRSG